MASNFPIVKLYSIIMGIISKCQIITHLHKHSIPGYVGCIEIAFVSLDWPVLLLPWHPCQMSTYSACKKHKHNSVLHVLYVWTVKSVRQALQAGTDNGREASYLSSLEPATGPIFKGTCVNYSWVSKRCASTGITIQWQQLVQYARKIHWERRSLLLGVTSTVLQPPRTGIHKNGG